MASNIKRIRESAVAVIVGSQAECAGRQTIADCCWRKSQDLGYFLDRKTSAIGFKQVGGCHHAHVCPFCKPLFLSLLVNRALI